MLLVSEEGLPASGDVPHCECGAPRVFEFQVCSFCYFLNSYVVSSLSSLISIGCNHHGQYQFYFIIWDII